ncbi:hypothetical protein C8R45DRAFT_1037826 [Mycena sanguinolenta]|nr:hypothetical protein C8R45DRAFT_1037826 [Mycena sanguinolenta]
MNSDTETPSENDFSFWNDRELKFRVLILGRANAGKTTILERLTGANMDEAEVWRDGEILPGQAWICLSHDSHSVEAGSVTELSTVQQFVDKRSLAVRDVQHQLHVIWICLPLDDCRELFESERDIFRLLKGAAPLVVIFTKQDGAVSKETSQLLMDFPENTCSRSARKEARRKAELEVINRVKELEGELMSMGLVDNATAFLTTSGMEMPTVDADKSCQQLIDLTEECLTGPRIKTLLSIVWGRNLLKRGFWCLYWTLRSNTSDEGVKLGSGAPRMWSMIREICIQMVSDMTGCKSSSFHSAYSLCSLVLLCVCIVLCESATLLSACSLCSLKITKHLESLVSSLFHMPDPTPTDLHVLAIAVLLIIVFHAVHRSVLTSVSHTTADWIQTVASFIEDNKVPLHEKANNITAQIAAIVGEMKHRNIIPSLNLHYLPWKLSDKEATTFATELSQAIQANLM